MKFNSQTHAQMAVRILEAVKVTLPRERTPSSQSPYICDNISQASRSIDTNLADSVATTLRNWISQLIDHDFSLESWLRKNHDVARSAMDEEDYYEKLQTTRHAWLKWMIQEIKTNNDL